MSHIDVGLVSPTMGQLRGSQIGVEMLSVLLLQLTPNVFAQDSINDSKENLDQVRSSIANLQKSLSEKTIEFNSARKQVLEIERRLHLARRETKKFTRELGEKSLKITALVEQRETLTRSYSDTENTLSDIVVAKYRLSREQLVRDRKLEIGRLRDDEVQLEKLVADVRAIVKEEHAPRTPFKSLKGKLS